MENTCEQLLHCSVGCEENVGLVEQSGLEHCSVELLPLLDVVSWRPYKLQRFVSHQGISYIARSIHSLSGNVQPATRSMQASPEKVSSQQVDDLTFELSNYTNDVIDQRISKSPASQTSCLPNCKLSVENGD